MKSLRLRIFEPLQLTRTTYCSSRYPADYAAVLEDLKDEAGGTSLALRDAFAAVGVPFVEVHITNVHAREPERHRSTLASVSVGQVIGLGTYGYELALRGLVARLGRPES